MHWTYPKKIFMGILLILLIGACLLYAPISFNYESYEYVNNHFVFHMKPDAQNQFIGIDDYKIEYDFLDAIFMASSAFTDSGFSLINIGSDLSIFGQIVVFLLVQIGGFGYISIFYLIGMAVRNLTKKNVFSTSLLNIERGGTKISNSSTMIVRIFIIILAVQLFFAFVMSWILFAYPFKMQQDWTNLLSVIDKNKDFTFIIDGKQITFNSTDNLNKLLSLSFDNIYGKNLPSYQNYGIAFWHSLFLSSSAINNAGFDLFGSTSLQVFRNDFGILIQVIILLLILIGGIGFPVIYDLSSYLDWFFKHKIQYKLFKKVEYAFLTKPIINTYSKLCIYSWFYVTLISLGFLYGSEYFQKKDFVSEKPLDIQNFFSIINYPNVISVSHNGEIKYVDFFGEQSFANKNLSIFFTALSTRSAGFATVNMINFTEPSIIILSILMFIGTSPSSTGGGIRTTTLAVVVKSLYRWIRGIDRISFGKRRTPSKTVTNAYLILFISIILTLFMTFLIYVTSNMDWEDHNLILEEYKEKSIVFSFAYFFFECASAFGTSGLSVGIVGSQYFQWWNIIIMIILMFIGQLGVSSTLLIFARKIPKITDSVYLEQDIKIG